MIFFPLTVAILYLHQIYYIIELYQSLENIVIGKMKKKTKSEKVVFCECKMLILILNL